MIIATSISKQYTHINCLKLSWKIHISILKYEPIIKSLKLARFFKHDIGAEIERFITRKEIQTNNVKLYDIMWHKYTYNCPGNDSNEY